MAGRKSSNPQNTGVAAKAATSSVVEDKNMNQKTVVNQEPLNDNDEIEVISIQPNVMYEDKRTGDIYKWEEAGQVEMMDVATLKNLWRSHKGYFRNMYLKPLDERVVKLFGLNSTYQKYEYLTNKDSYKRANKDAISKTIEELPEDLKWSICGKIKTMVVSGELTDALMIRELENKLDMNLMGLLD